MTYKKQCYFNIKSLSQEDRPREKIVAHGKQALSKAELLAMVINTGIPNVNSVDLARQMLKKFDNSLSNIAKLSVKELTQFKGIGEAKAAKIVGVLELANRLDSERMKKKPVIKKSEDIYRIIKPKLSRKNVEEFWILLLNSQHRVIRTSCISKGGLAKTAVDTKVLLKESLIHNAIAIALVHNHPSGSTEPSISDIKLTQSIIIASQTLNLSVVDHVIFTDAKYYSFADEGLIDSLSKVTPEEIQQQQVG